MLKYKVLGNGLKKVIVLHELMGSCNNYETMIPFLDKDKFTYIFTDLRGYGLSKSLLGKYNLNEAISDLKELIDSFKISSIDIIAHSMSTMVAQNLALEDSRVSKLVLTTPLSKDGIKISTSAKERLLNKALENKDFIEDVVKSVSKRYNDVWYKKRVEMGYHSSLLNARVSYMNMYLNDKFEKDERKIYNKTLILTGKNDLPPFLKDEVLKKLNYIENFEIYEFSEATHYPMIETPILYLSVIEKFLNHEH